MGPQPDAWCNPSFQNCTGDKLRMFKLENHYFREACTPALKVSPVVPEIDPVAEQDTPVTEFTDAELDSMIKEETCKVKGCPALAAAPVLCCPALLSN